MKMHPPHLGDSQPFKSPPPTLHSVTFGQNCSPLKICQAQFIYYTHIPTHMNISFKLGHIGLQTNQQIF
jgi:hypothetical protein